MVVSFFLSPGTVLLSSAVGRDRRDGAEHDRRRAGHARRRSRCSATASTSGRSAGAAAPSGGGGLIAGVVRAGRRAGPRCWRPRRAGGACCSLAAPVLGDRDDPARPAPAARGQQGARGLQAGARRRLRAHGGRGHAQAPKGAVTDPQAAARRSSGSSGGSARLRYVKLVVGPGTLGEQTKDAARRAQGDRAGQAPAAKRARRDLDAPRARAERRDRRASASCATACSRPPSGRSSWPADRSARASARDELAAGGAAGRAGASRSRPAAGGRAAAPTACSAGSTRPSTARAGSRTARPRRGRAPSSWPTGSASCATGCGDELAPGADRLAAGLRGGPGAPERAARAGAGDRAAARRRRRTLNRMTVGRTDPLYRAGARSRSATALGAATGRNPPVGGSVSRLPRPRCLDRRRPRPRPAQAADGAGPDRRRRARGGRRRRRGCRTARTSWRTGCATGERRRRARATASATARTRSAESARGLDRLAAGRRAGPRRRGR